MTKQSKISLIVPVLNPGRALNTLLSKINAQTIVPEEIIVVDSESTDGSLNVCEQYENVKTLHISRGDFDHGGTRDWALRQAIGDIVLFTTQDALPVDDHYIENIVRALLSDEKIAMVCGRQIAYDDAHIVEKLTRQFNYSSQSNIRTKSDLDVYGIKTFYFSDVCSAYKKNIYEELGGFEYPINISEDMLIAAKAIFSDYKVAYCADAKVYHSHNFTLREQYNRNYQIGIFMKNHNDIFSPFPATKEGIKIVKNIFWVLLKQGKISACFYLFFQSIAKYLGYKEGSV